METVEVELIGCRINGKPATVHRVAEVKIEEQSNLLSDTFAARLDKALDQMANDAVSIGYACRHCKRQIRELVVSFLKQ